MHVVYVSLESLRVLKSNRWCAVSFRIQWPWTEMARPSPRIMTRPGSTCHISQQIRGSGNISRVDAPNPQCVSRLIIPAPGTHEKGGWERSEGGQWGRNGPEHRESITLTSQQFLPECSLHIKTVSINLTSPQSTVSSLILNIHEWHIDSNGIYLYRHPLWTHHTINVSFMK